MSNARTLSDMRLPLQPYFGGLQPDFISGINWECLIDNWVTIRTGSCICPYPAGHRVVSLTSDFSLNIPTQPEGTTRAHLWIQDDDGDGVGTVVIDNPPSFSPYFGNAFTNPTHPGWRYIGTVLMGTGRNPLRQRMEGNEVRFLTHIAGAPCELVNGTTTTAATTVTTNAVAPPTTITHIILNSGGTADVPVRYAPSAASCGYTVSASVYSGAMRPLCGELLLPLGNDASFQFAADTAGQSIAIRAIGYRFKR